MGALVRILSAGICVSVSGASDTAQPRLIAGRKKHDSVAFASTVDWQRADPGTPVQPPKYEHVNKGVHFWTPLDQPSPARRFARE